MSDFSDLDSTDDDSIDPRVQEELERLNNATDAINKLEVELDDSRAAFRQLLTESSQRINALAKKLGSSVDKARPYYEARMKAKEAHTETQKAALRFERANSALSVAKEMVFLAEEGLQKEGRTFDPAWQEMLNHATIRVNEAERERTFSEQEHKRTSKAYNEIDTTVKELQKELKKNIAKSRPYFEMKAQFNKMMEEQKRRVQELEERVLKAKMNYADALHNLEEISDEIHQKRKLKEQRRALGTRGAGVGAECPEPSTTYERDSIMRNHEYMELPSQLRLPKSLSSSTLSQILASQSSPDKQCRYSNRLRKSKSVVDRTEASPLFGRYSISRRNKLQVDHACQTDDDPTPFGRTTNVVVLPATPLTTVTLKSNEFNSGLTAINVCSECAEDVDSSSKSSLQSSEATSPMGLPSEFIRGAMLLPANAMTESIVSSDNGDISDAESLVSNDGLTDDQISSLMMENELQALAKSMVVKPQLEDQLSEVQHSKHTMTETNDDECPSNHLPKIKVKGELAANAARSVQ